MEALYFICQIVTAWPIMFAISEVHYINVWSQTATWKSTLFSEQCLTGALGGISGVSQSPSVPDTCHCFKYSAPISVAVEAELKVDV